MLDPKQLRENPDAFKDAATKKRVASPAVVDAWLAADEKRRAAQTKADSLRAEQGKIGGEVGKLKGKLKGGTSPELEALLARATELKNQNESAVAEQTAAEKEAAELMFQLPAIPDPSWPVGKDDTDNVVVRKWNAPGREPAPLAASQKNHIQLGESLGIIDFDRGVKIAGSRAYVMKGAGALLYNAVLRYAMDTLVAKGWEPFVVPVLVTEACMTGTGYFPSGRDQAYITQDNSVLAGTSEVALASYLGDEIVDVATLPRRMAAMSTCFRREAGAAGRDTAGLYRVHQFDKVEQVVVHAADEAEHIAIHEEIIANSEHLLQQLGLAYRVVQNCTGDMGQGKWRMYDIETWMPSRNGYGETHSGSALRDFQSRRLNLRYRKPGEKTPTFAYTLNNTAVACPRVLIAILETYQQPDGSVEVPDVLRPYMGGVGTIGKLS
jgi:seryl-tRNA synthetase